MTAASLDYATLLRLAGNRMGKHDAACPSCGPGRRSPAKQRRKVLRVWRITSTFLTYRCARCDLHGYARADGAPAPNPVELAKVQAEAHRFAASTAEAKRRKARWLWGQRRPIVGTPAERYLREARCYGGPLPATIGFLPARGDHSPAMISAFGLPVEVEPGVISIPWTAVMAVHLTRLSPDGSAKAAIDTAKIMIGTPRGAPIALAAVGDLLGLAMTEGVEDGLSVFEATGLGTWAAGSASFLPTLARAIPSYVESVTIVVDADDAGRRHSGELAQLLRGRGFEVRAVDLCAGRAAA
jgi:hypothetical protein